MELGMSYSTLEVCMMQNLFLALKLKSMAEHFPFLCTYLVQPPCADIDMVERVAEVERGGDPG